MKTYFKMVIALGLSLACCGIGAQPDQTNGARDPSARPENQGSVRLLNPPKPGERWWMREGKGYTLCEAMYAKYQPYTQEDIRICPDALALTLPGMRELSGWVELDPRDYGNLYKNLMQYDRVGLRAYFGADAERFEQFKSSPESLERAYQDFLLELPKARMRMLRRQFFVRSLDETTYTMPQTIIEIRRPWSAETCPRMTSSPERVSTYYVTPDLSGPDPHIPIYEVEAAKTGRFVEYKGVAHLMVTASSDIEFYRDLGAGYLQSFCDIRYQAER
jgi:hypothetical protein